MPHISQMPQAFISQRQTPLFHATLRVAFHNVRSIARTLNEEQIYLLPAEFWNLNYFTSFSGFCSLVILSQLWLPTVQLVLHADWQVDLHSPQAVIFFCAGFAMVLIILQSPSNGID